MGTFIKHPRTYFILGLLIGLAVGLFFSIYNKNKENIKELSAVIFSYTDSTINKSTIQKTKPIRKKKKPKHKNTKPKKAEIIQDSILNDSIKLSIDSILKTDSIKTDSTLIDSSCINKENDWQNDSLQSNIIDSNSIIDSFAIKDSTLDTSDFDDKEVIIARDELIYSEYIIPQGKKTDFLCSTFGELDSVLTNNIVTHDQEGIYVEFWQSPLNSTGYKLSHNTLILFGFYQYKSVNLKYLKNGKLKILEL